MKSRIQKKVTPAKPRFSKTQLEVHHMSQKGVRPKIPGKQARRYR